MRQNKKENKNKRKNEEWIQKARHASSVKDIAHASYFSVVKESKDGTNAGVLSD